MSAEGLEAFLARVLVDADLRERFRADPGAEAERAGLTRDEQASLTNIDWVGLELAARSFARKRAHRQKRRRTLREKVLQRWRRSRR